MVIGLVLYAAPLSQGTALVASEPVLADLQEFGYLLAYHPSSVRLDILVPAAVRSEALTGEATLLLRRAMAAATMQRAVAPAGPSGRWFAVLIAWGWLLVLMAAQSWSQVAGGLWFGLGLPWARRAHWGRAQAWLTRGAAGLSAAVAPVHVRQVEHAGLAQIAALFESRNEPNWGGAPLDGVEATDADLYRAAEAQCVAAGLVGLAPVYAALAAGEGPSCLWTLLSGSKGHAVK